MKYRIAGLLAVGLAFSAAACSTPATKPVAEPSSPTVAPTAAATTTPAVKSGGGGGGSTGSTDSWKGVNFVREAYVDLACTWAPGPKDDADVSSVTYADLTGDGKTEAIVSVDCPTRTSTNPAHVLVFDGSQTGGKLWVRLDIGKDQYLRHTHVTTSGRSITVKSDAVSDHTGLCCADLSVNQTYTYTGGQFHRTKFEQKSL
jgi:hypothetical protein